MLWWESLLTTLWINFQDHLSPDTFSVSNIIFMFTTQFGMNATKFTVLLNWIMLGKYKDPTLSSFWQITLTLLKLVLTSSNIGCCTYCVYMESLS